jgi:SET domain-containing protein
MAYNGLAMEPASVVVKPSPIHGKGVFAATDFQEGDVILRFDDSRLVTEENPRREGESVFYCERLPDGRVAYGQEPERYTNHSCDPSAYIKEAGGVRYLAARREISAGEEITTDYSIDKHWGDVWWHCDCGAARCRETVYNDFFRLPLEIQIEYLPYLTQAYRERFREQVEELEREAARR